MNKNILKIIFCAGLLVLSETSYSGAFHTDSAQRVTYSYNFSSWSIPANVGGSTWFDDHGLYAVDIDVEYDGKGYADLTINGTPTGTLSSDGATVYKTNNPGVGIAYQLNYSTPGLFTPNYGVIAPNTITITSSNVSANGFMHIKYQLVRLTEKVPAGPITTVPDVILNYHNPPGSAQSNLSFLALSGVSVQPMVTSCVVDAPTEIKLPTIYGTDIVNGAVKPTDAPVITLKNCPGAINGINYAFSAVYGTHTASEGLLKTVEGDGYAKEIFIQIQHPDGTAHAVNKAIPIEGYDGSGDYTIPNFRVAYYIEDANKVTAGNVKTAIELKVTYN
ncbi:fimbrial protein [Superficieibacter sp. HKU1]|uniref:fimbrial protein n=1 Tax=Superficieibacter sp. HKU1 TaxID=3031919 RepID=UPI0023E1D427|nr:fimbrial protein [Superficieibacter sp. HKU1]WES69613.1 fimbrial protein [Superficieibacter sp. HKU1]